MEIMCANRCGQLTIEDSDFCEDCIETDKNKWNFITCSICKQQLFNDDLVEIRKQRHEQHHSYQGGSKNVSKGKVTWQ